jgi:hypothetical protein
VVLERKALTPASKARRVAAPGSAAEYATIGMSRVRGSERRALVASKPSITGIMRSMGIGVPLLGERDAFTAVGGRSDLDAAALEGAGDDAADHGLNPRRRELWVATRACS